MWIYRPHATIFRNHKDESIEPGRVFGLGSRCLDDRHIHPSAFNGKW
jgi:hypothetical protein